MTSTRRTAYAVALVASLLLAADLLLEWRSATVRVGGAVAVEAGSAGWDGAGFAAGLGALAVAVVSAAALTGGREHPRLVLLSAMVALAGVLLAAFTESATVVAPGAEVAVESTRWPAWAGVGLAAVAAGAALVAYAPGAPTSSSESSRSRRWASGS